VKSKFELILQIILGVIDNKSEYYLDGVSCCSHELKQRLNRSFSTVLQDSGIHSLFK
jgi:hypothetical protein